MSAEYNQNMSEELLRFSESLREKYFDELLDLLCSTAGREYSDRYFMSPTYHDSRMKFILTRREIKRRWEER